MGMGELSPGCCECGGGGGGNPLSCTAPAPTLTMTWFYFNDCHGTSTAGPLTTTLTWDGFGAFDSGVLPLPSDACACIPDPLGHLCHCCFYQMRINCDNTPGTFPNGAIFIWPDSSGAAGTGGGSLCGDPAFTLPSGQACNLPANQTLHPTSNTTSPFSVTYGPNDVAGMASGMLTL
jgi:hypothetical protein